MNTPISIENSQYIFNVPPMDENVPDNAKTRDGKYVRLIRKDVDGKIILNFQNKGILQLEDLNRDTSWKRRQEIRALLLEEIEDTASFDMSAVVLDLLEDLDLEALQTLTKEERLRRFHENSHELFRQRVHELLEGDNLDKANPVTDPQDPNYSHIGLFSTLYAHQIKEALSLAENIRDRKITVTDLGGGFGHLALLLAEEAKKREMKDRFRIVSLDISEQDQSLGREYMWRNKCPVEFAQSDVLDPNFADILRRYKPDLVTSNHMLEHLDGPDIDYFKNRVLHDWLLAAHEVLSVAVPLDDPIEKSLSSHKNIFKADTVKDLAESMIVRVGFGAEAQEPEKLSKIGMMSLRRTKHVFNACSIIVPGPRHYEFTPECLARPFNLEGFKQPSYPIDVGRVEDIVTFEQQGNLPRQVRQLLIKVPGNDRIYLPTEFGQVAEVAQIVADHNRSANPWWNQAYGYLNVFRGQTNFNSYRGLSLNCHTDQMQSIKVDEGYMPDWSYIVSNCVPTAFFPGPFDVDEAIERARAGERVNLYDYFNAQAKGMKDTMWSATPNTIYLLSPYDVHSATSADEPMFRIFTKVAFSQKRFFDNRQLVTSTAFDNDDWYRQPTVGFVDGYFSHAHWNERYLAEDMPRADYPKTSGAGNIQRLQAA